MASRSIIVRSSSHHGSASAAQLKTSSTSVPFESDSNSGILSLYQEQAVNNGFSNRAKIVTVLQKDTALLKEQKCHHTAIRL